MEKHRLWRIGVAGHPEGHREVADDVLGDALHRRTPTHAGSRDAYIVTQFTFSADPIVAWEHARRDDIGQLPVIVGAAGLASTKTLLKYPPWIAASVRRSRHFSKRAASLTKLLTVSTPDDIVVGLARHKAQSPESPLAGSALLSLRRVEADGRMGQQTGGG